MAHGRAPGPGGRRVASASGNTASRPCCPCLLFEDGFARVEICAQTGDERRRPGYLAADDSVDGELDWHNQRTGDNGIEYVRGTYDASTGKVDIAGYQVSDASLGTDVYALVLDREGGLSGKSRNNDGRWGGRFSAHAAP